MISTLIEEIEETISLSSIVILQTYRNFSALLKKKHISKEQR